MCATLSVLMNTTMDEVINKLHRLGLSRDESLVYIELLRGPSNHTRLSHATGVNRTKVYRVAGTLEKMGLISKRADDRGSALAANDLSGLELRLIEIENKLKQQRDAMAELRADLSMFRGYDPGEFFINTYEGVTGFKQMTWNELRTEGETLALGNGTIEELVTDREWAQRHRQRQIEAGYRAREITNYHYETNQSNFFTAKTIESTGLYQHRMISPHVINFDGQTVIYNSTVAIYHWKHERKVGLEIICANYANMMRQIFEQYWSIAEES